MTAVYFSEQIFEKKIEGLGKRQKECVRVREKFLSSLLEDDPQSIGPGSSLQLLFSASEAPCLISAKVI